MGILSLAKFAMLQCVVWMNEDLSNILLVTWLISILSQLTGTFGKKAGEKLDEGKYINQ